MNDIEVFNGVQVMDSRVIAQLTGKEHRKVCRDIVDQIGQLPNIAGGVASFGHTYRNEQNGQEYRCFKLPRRECLILVAGYDIHLRAAIIDRWEALETGKAAPVATRIRLPRVLSGSLVNAMAKVYGSKEAGKRLDQLIGYTQPPVVREPLQVGSSPEITAQLEALVSQHDKKTAQVVAAVTTARSKVLVSKMTQALKTGQLDLGVF